MVFLTLPIWGIILITLGVIIYISFLLSALLIALRRTPEEFVSCPKAFWIIQIIVFSPIAPILFFFLESKKEREAYFIRQRKNEIKSMDELILKIKEVL